MKNWKFLSLWTLIAMLGMGLAACTEPTTGGDDEQDPPQPPVPEKNPTVVVTADASKSTEASVTFTITPAESDQVRYMFYETGTVDTPSAEQILNEGKQVRTDKATTLTIDELTYSTTYVVIAAAKGGEKVVASDPVEISTLDPQPITVTFDRAGKTETGIKGNWYLGLANDEWRLVLDLYADPEQPILPAGTYELGENTTGFCGKKWTELSLQPEVDEEGNVVEEPEKIHFESGKVIVETENGASYKISVDFVMANGAHFIGAYEGVVSGIEPPKDPNADPDPFVFTLNKATYNRDASGSSRKEFYIDIAYDNDDDPTMLIEGSLDFLLAETSRTLPAGTYSIEEGTLAANYSYLRYWDRTVGEKTERFNMTTGTVTVSVETNAEGKDIYTFVINTAGVDPNTPDVKPTPLQGTFTGEIARMPKIQQ